METTIVNFKVEPCDIKITRTQKNEIPDPPAFGCFGNPYPVKYTAEKNVLNCIVNIFIIE